MLVISGFTGAIGSHPTYNRFEDRSAMPEDHLDPSDQSRFVFRLQHPSFAQPKERNVPVWRYMNLAKYVSMLSSKSLVLSRLDRFSDPFEGSLPKLWVELMTKWLSEDGHGSFEELRPFYMKMRQCIYASCWHISNFESEAMWRLYGGSDGGIAVQTTYEALAESIRDEPNGYIGLVKYVDYETAVFPDNNVLHLPMHKRIAFRHEQEVRVVRYEASPTSDQTCQHLIVSLPWDTEKHTCAVYVDPSAPQYFFDSVRTVTDALAPALTSRIRWSKIKDAPTD